MAVVLGTNSGFVITAPTVDPAGTVTTVDTLAVVTKDTSPATAGKISEIGWWCNEATEASNFEVGLYAADGVVVPGEAGTLLYSSIINAKGTTSGWKTVSVDWGINANTVYWISLQLDDTATATNTYRSNSGGSGFDQVTASSLPNPFNGGTPISTTQNLSIYAVWKVDSLRFDIYKKQGFQ